MKAHALFPYFLGKCLAIPTLCFLHLLVNGYCVIVINFIMSIQFISCKNNEKTIIEANNVNKYSICQCYSVPFLLFKYPSHFQLITCYTKSSQMGARTTE